MPPPSRPNPFAAEQERRAAATANRFDAEIARRAAPGGLPGRPSPEAAAQDSAIRQGLVSMTGRVLENLIGLPRAFGDLIGMNPASQAFAPTAVLGPALRAMPAPTSQEILAVAGTPQRVPGAMRDQVASFRANQAAGVPLSPTNPAPNPLSAISTAYRGALDAENANVDANPLAASAGRTAGDVATLLTLRPGARVRELLTAAPRVQPTAAPGVRNAVERAANTFGRGLGRTAEAGFEGALMGALGDADPLKTAAFSAGIQAGGSAALTAKSVFLRKPITSFVGLYMGNEIWRAIAPGPQDLFSSKDEAINTLIAAYGLGAVAGLAGAGRGIGSGNIERITTVLTAAPRHTIQSVITQLQEASARNEPQYARVLQAMSADPDYFGPDARRRLERSVRRGGNALLEEIDSLMKNARFRHLYEELPGE